MKWDDLQPRLSAIEGLLCEGQDKWLFDCAAELKPKSRILEIGCYKGMSTCCLYGGAQESDSDLTSIDICAPHADWTLASINSTFGTVVKFRQIVGSSIEEIPTMFMNGERFDLVFVDGHHLFPIVSCDILNSLVGKLFMIFISCFLSNQVCKFDILKTANIFSFFVHHQTNNPISFPILVFQWWL